MTRGTRRLSVVVMLVAALAVLASSCTSNGDAWNSAVLVNQTRHANGVADVHLDDVLTRKAQSWAENMAANGVRHSTLTDGVGTNWQVLGENVGWARSVEEMHQMFLNSRAHRTTMLDRRYTRFGVGIAVVDGRYYTVQVYAG